MLISKSKQHKLNFLQHKPAQTIETILVMFCAGWEANFTEVFITPFLPVNKCMKVRRGCNAITSKLICFEPGGKKPFMFHGWMNTQKAEWKRAMILNRAEAMMHL